MKKMGIVAGAVALALSLAGCFRAEQHITLKEDNTVDGTLIIAMAGGGDLTQLTGGEDPTTDFINATSEPFSDGEWEGQKITFSAESLDTFSSDNAVIVREGDEFVVTGSLGSEEEFTQYGTDPEPIFVISVTFPGKVTEHNGSLNGKTVTWDIADGQFDISARGSAIFDDSISEGNASSSGDDDGGIPSWLIILIVVAVIGGIAYYVSKNKNDGADEAPASK